MKRSTTIPSERRTFWQGHLASWRASGLSQAAYCREHELITHRFRWWKRQLEPARVSTEETATMPFLPVTVPAPVLAQRSDGESGLCVRLAGGMRIDIGVGFDAATLRAVVQTLGG